ncbi:MAG: hypothetical protein IT386_09130, partial [Deltaproteobacteria bacterium]|nr:hypothetical protein [Deltaproteobacteria bacterium]
MTRNTTRISRIALAAVLGLALAACDRPGPHEGYGVLDRSVYDDPARDVLPVADVVKR